MKNAFRFTRSARTVATRSGMIALALLVMVLTGCNTVDPDPPPETPPTPAQAPAPTITMSSTEVALVGGGRGLQFFARASADVFYQRVTIEPPPPFREFTHDLGNTFVSEKQAIALQTEGIAYRKVEGLWSFAYEVTTGLGAKAQSHRVIVTERVVSKKSADLSEDLSLTGNMLR